MNETIEKVKQTGQKVCQLLTELLKSKEEVTYKTGGQYGNSRFDLVNEYECF